MTYFKKKKSLEIEYAKRVAMAEVLDFKQGIIKRKVSDYQLYNNDLDLMQKHKRFLSYIYSTIERYTVHRNIHITSYYAILKVEVCDLIRITCRGPFSSSPETTPIRANYWVRHTLP